MLIKARLLSLLSILMLGMVGCSLHHQDLARGLQQAYQVPAPNAQRIAPLILQESQQQKLDPLLLAAVIRQESSYRTQARSPAGAVGLTQVMPQYWQTSCPGNLYNEAINIACGAMILNQYYQQTDSWNKALAYYNVGPTGYQRSSSMRQQGEKYAKSVKKHRKQLKKAL